MATFERKTPSPADLSATALDDFKRADAECEKINLEISKVRHTPPSLSDCMSVMREVVKIGAEDFEKLADERLAYLIGPEFDRRYLYDLNLTMHQRHGSVVHNAVFALIGDEFLRFAENRLRAMGADKSKLTLEGKAKKLAELEAAFSEMSAIRSDALLTWRRLTGKQGDPE